MPNHPILEPIAQQLERLNEKITRQDEFDKKRLEADPSRILLARPMIEAERDAIRLTGRLRAVPPGHGCVVVVARSGGRLYSTAPPADMARLNELSDAEILARQTGVARQFVEHILAGRTALADALADAQSS